MDIVEFPSGFLTHLAALPDFEVASFEQAHHSELPVSIRYNSAKKNIAAAETLIRVPWTTEGYYLPSRPLFTLDPLLHAGAYYVQEAGSMLLEQAIRQTVDLCQPLKVLDLCAAPGGKSTLLQSLITNDSLLVANEVIQSRVNILKENLIKWGGMNVVITQNDPKDFQVLPGFFDIMVIDAPCSGSGLFRRDSAAMQEWSLSAVQLCVERQRRIIADAWTALANDGILVYATCSFSKEENEAQVDWILSQFEVASLSLQMQEEWGIRQTMTEKNGYAYRCWPHLAKGEGFFMALFRKKSTEEVVTVKTKNRNLIAAAAAQSLASHVQSSFSLSWVLQGKYFAAVHPEHHATILFLMEYLRVRYAGVETGQLLHDEFIPEPALALSFAVHPNKELVELDEKEAIAFLRKESFMSAALSKGWQWVGYQSLGLGWIKSLGNRINNYHPSSWRIRMSV